MIETVFDRFEEFHMNENKRENFSKKMTDILNYGALNLAMAIGYRTGLFEVMDGFDLPKTVSAIAEKAERNSRYLREWLGVMVCGGIVELTVTEAGENLFFLPREYGDFMTTRSGHDNIGLYTQEIPLLTTCAMDPVIQGFYSGDGVDYDHYPKFQDFMSQLANAKHHQVLLDQFLPSIENGQLIQKLNTGIQVCDIGCAEGIALMLMAKAFPASEFVGMDISEEVITKAETSARQQGLRNVTFLQTDATTLKEDRAWEKSFDYVTAFDVIHDLTRPIEALESVYSILKSGGLFSMVDIAASSSLLENKTHPMGPFLYTVSLMHCMPVGLVEGGRGLGMMWGHQKAVEMLEDAGFTQVEVLEIPTDSFNSHFFCRR
jgi:ubiquinone/menaquinone biosynthesis C-methylase UbiE